MPEDGNQLLLWIERSIGDINRRLIATHGAKIYSLDDDHMRQASRAVTQFTDLQSINNPSKALGPVQNAICCPLTSLYITGHFTRKGDKMDDIWEVLAMRVQGAASRGSLKLDADAIYAADRGYNCTKTTEFVTKTLGATLLGTHKRTLDYPFVFGDAPITKKHKGVHVSEKGSRSVYAAVKRTESSSTLRAVEAFIYRESVGGRIAAMVHNNQRLFGSEQYTIVSKETYKNLGPEELVKRVGEKKIVFERKQMSPSSSLIDLIDGEANTPDSGCDDSTAKEAMSALMANVREMTFFQSADPTWFLLRAFRFTSTTAYAMISSVAKCFDLNAEVMVQFNGLTTPQSEGAPCYSRPSFCFTKHDTAMEITAEYNGYAG